MAFTPIGLGVLGRRPVALQRDHHAGRVARRIERSPREGRRRSPTRLGCRAGGTLITLGGATSWAAREDVNLTSARPVAKTRRRNPRQRRRLRDDRFTARERAPDRTQSDLLAATSPSASSDDPVGPPGSHFDVVLDRTHWLTHGYERPRLTVMFDRGTFLKLEGRRERRGVPFDRSPPPVGLHLPREHGAPPARHGAAHRRADGWWARRTLQQRADVPCVVAALDRLVMNAVCSAPPSDSSFKGRSCACDFNNLRPLESNQERFVEGDVESGRSLSDAVVHADRRPLLGEKQPPCARTDRRKQLARGEVSERRCHGARTGEPWPGRGGRRALGGTPSAPPQASGRDTGRARSRASRSRSRALPSGRTERPELASTYACAASTPCPSRT